MTATAHADLMDRAHLQLRFFHLHKLAMAARGGVTPDDLAPAAERLAGVGTAARVAIEDEFAAQVQRSAELLAADPEVQEALTRLPFAVDDRIVALGDSITDDALSWAMQLRALLTLTRPELRLTVHNHGFTGDTTQNAIARFDVLAAERPQWVIQLLGTNDIRRHGRAGVRMATLMETRRNLQALRSLIEQEVRAKLVVLTPPPIDDARLRAWQPFTVESIRWDSVDIDELADAMRADPGDVVDLHAAMSAVDLTPLQLPDGLHPSLAGQRFIARTVVLGLAART